MEYALSTIINRFFVSHYENEKSADQVLLWLFLTLNKSTQISNFMITSENLCSCWVRLAAVMTEVISHTANKYSVSSIKNKN